MKNILAIDAGTQSLKASVITSDYETIERKTSQYRPDTAPGNCVDIDAGKLWTALKEVCGKLENKNLSGIVFSTLCPSLLLMDSNGKPLTKMILHLDRRSREESGWIVAKAGLGKLRSITGNPPIPGGISITSMLWVKKQYGGNLPDGSVFGHAVTYFMKKMAGRFFMDPSNASLTGLYNTIEYSDWNEELMSLTGIGREHLPELLDSFSIAGLLEKDAADELGLAAGLPGVIGANDTTCAVAGAGIKEPGMLLNTCGTVELLVLCSDKPVCGPNHLLRTHAYRDRWLLMRTLGAGGASIEWVRSNFYRDMNKKDFYTSHIEKVLGSPRDSGVEFDPYLTGDRHSLEPLKASLRNLTLDSTRDDILYSVAYNNAKYVLGIIPEWEKTGRIGREIYHVGGGAGEGYTNIKKMMMENYKFINIGETAEKGAAIIGFGTLSNSINKG